MSCQNYVLDEDGARICECGDEGRLCKPCADGEAAFWAAEYNAERALEERRFSDYAQDMRDAGRGHLLPPET